MRQIPNFLNNKYLEKTDPPSVECVKRNQKTHFGFCSMHNIWFYRKDKTKDWKYQPTKTFIPTKIPTFARRKTAFLCRNTTKQSVSGATKGIGRAIAEHFAAIRF